MEERARIIEAAERIYAQNGFYKTTMDDIARELKASKKTLYKHFSSKDELLKSVVDQIMEALNTEIAPILTGKKDTIVKLYLLARVITNRISKISNVWLNDLKVYKPDLWKEIEQFQAKVGTKNLLTLINEAKSEQLVSEFPNELIITVLMSAVQGVVNPDFIINHNISINNAIDSTLKIIFYGFLTKKGKKFLKEYIVAHK